MDGNEESVTVGVDDSTDLALRRYVRFMLVASGASAVLYLVLLGNPFGSHVFSNFYDVQARALLDGHLAVPPDSLGIEAFVIDGDHFMYFPPGPALLRMPLFTITDRLDGRLTGASMLTAWVLTTVLVGMLLWRVRRLFRGADPLGRLEAGAYGLFLVAVCAGSVVLFLASIPWVYHEAYAWAIATALGSLYCLLGLIERPTAGRVVTTGLFTLATAMSRTTAGWACALAVIATAAWFLSGRRGERARRLGRWVAVAGAVPLVIASAVNFAKFGHPFMFPLEDQVFTGLSQQRRDALAANGGDLVSPDIFFSTAVNYFRPEGIRFTAVFPFITLPSEVARSYGGGFLDQTYRTGSVVNFMPVLLVLSIWGVITTFRPRGPRGAVVARLPLFAALAIPGAVMFYGYIAHRYTSEFVPLLVLGGAIGLVDGTRRLTSRERPIRVGVLAAVALAVAFSVAANFAVSVQSHASARPGARLHAYVRGQYRLSELVGSPLAGYVEMSNTLPTTSRADELRIIGDCQALYLGTGVDTDPWVAVEIRPAAFRVSVGGPRDGTEEITGRAVVATVDGYDPAEVTLERRGDRFRLVLEGEEDLNGRWFEAGDDGQFLVTVNPEFEDAYIVAGPDGGVLFVPKRDVDEDLSAVPNTVLLDLDHRAAEALDLEMMPAPNPPLDLCEQLRALDGGQTAAG